MLLSDAWAGLQFIADSTFHKLSKWSQYATPLFWKENLVKIQDKLECKVNQIFGYEGGSGHFFGVVGELSNFQNKISAQLRQLKKHCTAKNLSKSFLLSTPGPQCLTSKNNCTSSYCPLNMHNQKVRRKYSCSRILPNPNLPRLHKIMFHLCKHFLAQPNHSYKPWHKKFMSFSTSVTRKSLSPQDTSCKWNNLLALSYQTWLSLHAAKVGSYLISPSYHRSQSKACFYAFEFHFKILWL